VSTQAARRRKKLFGLLRAFRDATAALPDALVSIDDEQRVLWFNAAAGRLLRLQYPQHLDMPIGNAVSLPGLTDWIRAGGAEALNDLEAPGDENVHLSLRLIPYAEDHALLLARDVTHLLRLEKMRRDFVANVSHELRTPLTVVHGYLDLIEPEQIPEFESIMRELRNQSRRMTQIVEDLLTLSRLDAEEELPQSRVAMRPLLATLQRDAEGLSQGRHTISVDVQSDGDLKGSAKDLYSAFSNLVSNAVRYTPIGGRIDIQWLSDANGGRLIVRDTGHGIAAQHLPRLTERFYRVSTSRSRESGGTGLGLSIVKHVLQLHDAHLEIESSIGVGSTFSCVFAVDHVLPPDCANEEE
jgi:two-component system phosphate regulon sensor histidine kinase PhoR